MSHPCKTKFWGEGAAILIQWFDYLDEQIGPQSVRYMSKSTWRTVCVLQFELERATGLPQSPPPTWIGGAGFDDGIEADFRALSQVLLSLLVADQYDGEQPNSHLHSTPNWINSGVPTPAPEFGAKTLLIGGPPGPFPTPASVLGRVRNVLGS